MMSFGKSSLWRRFAVFSFMVGMGATLQGQALLTRQVVPDDELIANSILAVVGSKTWPEGWKQRGNREHSKLVPRVPGTDLSQGRVFEFSAKNAGAQQVVLLGRDWATLEVRYFMKTEDVVRGSASWQDARVALRYIDSQWNTVTPWPKVKGASGTSDWREYVLELPISEGADALVVEPAMFGESGTAWFADISVRVVAFKSDGSARKTEKGAKSGSAR